MPSTPFCETSSTLTLCSGSIAGPGIQSVGTASVTGLRGEGELRLTALLQGAELRKAKGDGQISAGGKCHGVWFQRRARNYLPT